MTDITADMILAKVGEPTRGPKMADLLLTRRQLAALPKPEPLIEDTLDRRTVVVLAGHYGTFKSFIALDWSCCIATGRMWQRRHVQTGRTLYVAAEGAYGMDNRVSAWEYGWRRQVPDDGLVVYPNPVNLTRADQVAELCEIAAGYDLVTLDTVARCAVGADENSARDMGLIVDASY